MGEFKFCEVFYEAAQLLPEEKQLKFYRDVVSFGLFGNLLDPEGDEVLGMAYVFVRGFIEGRYSDYE